MKHLLIFPFFVFAQLIIMGLASLVWLFDRRLYHMTDLGDCFIWGCIKQQYKNFTND